MSWLSSILSSKSSEPKAASNPYDATVISAQNAQKLVSGLNYQRIDLGALQKTVQEFARQNATSSLQLEKDLNPSAAATREILGKQVADNAALGGNIGADVANKVTQAANAQAGSAGLVGGGGPITAARLGLTSMDLQNQRMGQSANYLAANPLQKTGIDPGAAVGLSVADLNQTNQFNIDKTYAQAAAERAVGNAQTAAGTYADTQAKLNANNSYDGGVGSYMNGLRLGDVSQAQGGAGGFSPAPVPGYNPPKPGQWRMGSQSGWL